MTFGFGLGPNPFPVVPYGGGAGIGGGIGGGFGGAPLYVPNTAASGFAGGLPGIGGLSGGVAGGGIPATDLGIGGGALDGLGAVAGGGAAGAEGGGLLASLMPTWPGLGAVALPLGAGMIGKGIIDRIPFIPGSANDAGSAKSILGDAALGAGVGAAAGSIIPVLGTGVGALAGGALGGLAGYFGIGTGSGSSGPSPSDQATNAQDTFGMLNGRLAALGPTGQATAQQLDSMLQMQLLGAQDSKGKVADKDRQAIYDQFNKSIMQVYSQALQQDSQHAQLLQNMTSFQNAWSGFAKSQPFQQQQQDYLKQATAQAQYLQGLAGGLKGNGSQQYAHFLVGEQLRNAYAQAQQQQAAVAMAPYQLAMMMAGMGMGQPQGGTSSSTSSSKSTATDPNAALLQLLAGTQYGGTSSGLSALAPTPTG